MANRLGISLGALFGTLMFFALMASDAAVKFFEDFEGHSAGSSVASTNSWTGDQGPRVNSKTGFTGSPTNIFYGTDVSSAPDDQVANWRNVGALNGSGNIYQFSYDAFSRNTPVVSHNAGMGLTWLFQIPPRLCVLLPAAKNFPKGYIWDGFRGIMSLGKMLLRWEICERASRHLGEGKWN